MCGHPQAPCVTRVRHIVAIELSWFDAMYLQTRLSRLLTAPSAATGSGAILTGRRGAPVSPKYCCLLVHGHAYMLAHG